MLKQIRRDEFVFPRSERGSPKSRAKEARAPMTKPGRLLLLWPLAVDCR
jgi:hypothetical protein